MIHHSPILNRGVLGAAALAFAGGAVAAKPDTCNRAEIPAEYKSDFSQIFPDWAAWEAAMKAMVDQMNVLVSRMETEAAKIK